MSMRAVSDDDLSDFFMNDPQLCLLGLSDETLVELYKTRRYSPNYGTVYMGAYIGEDLKGILKYDLFTSHCVNVHVYVSSSIHHTESVRPLVSAIKQYLIEEVDAIKAVLFVPSSCEHVHKFAPKMGFKQEGLITQCLLWRQKLVDLVVYGLDISKVK